MTKKLAAEAASHRVRGIGINGIVEIADRARNDAAVARLWIGESDLTTPDFINDAAIGALRAGETRYTYDRGLPRVHEALRDYHARHWGVDVAAERFSLTAGGVQAVKQALEATIDPGDEVVAALPTWPNLYEIIGITGGVLKPVPYHFSATDGWRLDVGELLAAVTPRTKVIALNSPSNPTGWTMSRDEMVAVRDVARTRGLWVISDEVYAPFTYNGKIAPSFLQISEPEDRLIVTNTFSKCWVMTGWRMGWAVFPPSMGDTFENLSQYATTSVATFLQHGGEAALRDGDSFVEEFVARCAGGRRIVCEALAQLPNVEFTWPEGTFYVLFRVKGSNRGRDFAIRALEEARVGLAPGEAFGAGGEPFVRLCFAVDHGMLRDAMDRLARIIGQYA